MRRAAFCVGLALSIFTLLFVEYAFSANSPHPTLNAIASEFAGKPVTVHCEANADTWDDMVAAVAPGFRGNDVNGYAFIGNTVAYIGPDACMPLLRALTTGYRDTGLFYTMLGLQVLLHESAHLRGIRDEGETDCTALAALPDYYDNLGVPATVTKLARKTKTVLVRGVKVRTSTVVTIKVPNPDIARMTVLAKQLHDSLPVEYRGAC